MPRTTCHDFPGRPQETARTGALTFTARAVLAYLRTTPALTDADWPTVVGHVAAMSGQSRTRIAAALGELVHAGLVRPQLVTA